MSVTSTQGFVFRLMASGSFGWQQLDLFQDEDIKVSNNVTGGGGAHTNVQAGVGCYYIMYIP